ncbi:MAG TPA: D-aminoacylase [Gemmatimonadaceae bacterium]|nr:D-aminoacylase [Gemmatimonadaceae bacterium]
MTSRRSFLGTAGSALLGVAVAPSLPARPSFHRRAPHDVVIRGGTVFDGTGVAGRELDVAISGDRIAAIAPHIAGHGVNEIDARGLAVAPGFIDIHSHGDGSLDDDPRDESVIRQGVTTIVAGQDGSSRATGAPESSFAQYFAAMEALRPGPNVASMVGLGTLRGAVIGDMDRSATADEIERMAAMVERALADGACGASSGLEYTPGAFASREELIALCRPLASRRLPYATHMRNEDDRLLDAIDESIAVAKGAGCPLEISHLKTQGPRNWPHLDDVFARIDAAQSAGLDVTFDRYPYLAYSTGLTNLFPVWSRDGGTDAFLARLHDPAAAPRIRAATLAKIELIGGWDNVQLSAIPAVTDRDAEGKRLGSAAAAHGADPYDYTVALLERSHGSIGMAGFAMSEQNLERILADPRCMVCSDGGGFAIDGPTRRGSPHPRGIGTFPRVLGRYVRERKTLTLPDAIRRMTSAPAKRLRLADRGRLASGLAADVVIFDPARIADTATFEQPFQYPIGITAVLVNGAITLREGERAAGGTGRSLRAK